MWLTTNKTMQEKELIIPVHKGFNAYGNLVRKGKSKKLLILLPGLFNNKEHHLFYNASHFFSENNYAVWRYNLYGPQKKARKFEKTKFSDFTDDIEKIVEYFRKDYSDISLLAHSLSVWNALLTSTKNINKLVFWEPSLHPQEIFAERSINVGFSIKVPKLVQNSIKMVPKENELFSNLTKPLLIVSAGKANPSIGRRYFELVRSQKTFKIIPTSNHTFDQDESKLFSITLKWLRLPH